MGFHDLPDLGPMLMPGAAEYGTEFIALGERAARSIPNRLDIPYGSDPFQKLDVWQPAHDSGAAPVIVFIHGGAFRNGHKEWIGAMAPALTALPAVVVSPNYRLVPQVRVPDAVEDCFTALAWVRANIAGHGGDPDRIFVGGHSAGGHLAAMLAMRQDELARHGVPLAAIRGCLPLSGVFSMIREEHDAASPVVRFWDQMVGDDVVGRACTASTYAAGNAVPFYLALGDREPSEVARGNAEMLDLAKRHGFLAASEIFAGADHFDAHRRALDPDGSWVRTVATMLGG
jgi:acetyl esterase/lipase